MKQKKIFISAEIRLFLIDSVFTSKYNIRHETHGSDGTQKRVTD